MKSFKEAPLLLDFADTTRWDALATVPNDWLVVISDVKNSTPAIEAGKYKTVNTVGASSIMAALNAADVASLGYVFGGDGATFLVPPQFAEAVLNALFATRDLARTELGLELRIGAVPVQHLTEKGWKLRCARFQVAEGVTQAVISGDGIFEAERWIKGTQPNNPYLLTNAPTSAADLTGLECRWSPVKSLHGEVVSLLVLAVDSPERDAGTYANAVKKVEEIYHGPKPLSAEALRLAHAWKSFREEATVRSPAGRWFYQLKAFVVTQVAHAFWEWAGHAFGKRYKQELVGRTDRKKFDGVLRMTLDGNYVQRRELTAYLEKARAAGELVYGIHVSPAAIVTCLIFDRSNGGHFHFLDGSDGGYTRAAAQMKSQLGSAFCRFGDAA